MKGLERGLNREKRRQRGAASEPVRVGCVSAHKNSLKTHTTEGEEEHLVKTKEANRDEHVRAVSPSQPKWIRVRSQWSFCMTQLWGERQDEWSPFGKDARTISLCNGPSLPPSLPPRGCGGSVQTPTESRRPERHISPGAVWLIAKVTLSCVAHLQAPTRRRCWLVAWRVAAAEVFISCPQEACWTLTPPIKGFLVPVELRGLQPSKLLSFCQNSCLGQSEANKKKHTHCPSRKIYYFLFYKHDCQTI